MTPLETLRHHVTGAIERGEAAPIVGIPAKEEKRLFFIEITDTFGGEANYSWVTRHVIRAKSQLGAAQRLARLSGLYWHCVDKYSDTARYDSQSGATCAFISEYNPEYHDRFARLETDERG